MPFTKMQGLGNDYIYIDCFRTPADTLPDPAKLSARLSPRRTSVGADGLVLILPSDKATARMRMFNADGSEGLMCGNAIRCVGKYLCERGLISPDAREITVETASGIKELSLSVRDGKVDTVSVDMGVAEVSDEIVVETGGKQYHVIPVSVGNPHWVCLADDLCEVDVESEGARLSSAVEGGVNVEFVERIDENTLRMRVFERGSGVTLACGTGACASVAAAVSRGICPVNTPVTVLLDGGALTVILGEGGTLLMIGGAEFVFDGVWEGEI
ncbi:MAG: diaminopimelate epimerase [Clostridia bacterium]|nr:diaminopimelate epimerase [Clostridia bacterium]